jgi:hypothetical protein
MTQRIIWCPSCFSYEEWKKLSREEQIQWWRDRQPPLQALSPDPWRVVRCYQKGQITNHELRISVFQNLRDENVREFLCCCPDEILVHLYSAVKELPADDDDESWGKFVIGVAAAFPPWISEEEMLAEQRARVRLYREGVRLFRKAVRE